MSVQVQTIKAPQLRVLMGDGNSPEQFVEWVHHQYRPRHPVGYARQ
jgi:hypothetical protein